MVTEWEFTADVASWINEALPKYSHLPFSRAKCEQRSKGSTKRRDLSLLDKSDKVVLTGEVRFPWAKDGGTPFADGLVNNARKKAERAGTDYFFTWNVNQCVLFETRATAAPRHNWKCSAVLDGTPMTEPTGRAKFQIAVTVCQRCRQGWQEGAGAQIAIHPAAVDRAMCDAQHIGSIDGSTPERAYQDIPPSVARFVWRRDGGRCRVDGCRSSRGLELHHVIHRADGGSHDASNIILACSACHQSHHAGILTISGTADHLEVRRPGQAASAEEVHGLRAKARSSANTSAHVGAADVTTSVTADGAPMGVLNASTSATGTGAHVGAAHTTILVVGAGAHVDVAGVTTSVTDGDVVVRRTSRLDAAILHTQAKTALTALGWKPAIAAAAVAAAAEAQGAEVTLERLIFESLRRCPAPKA